MFAVVVFKDEQSVEVVHQSWIFKNGDDVQCYWPKSGAKSKARKGEHPDTETWKTFDVRVLTETDDFETAIKKCCLAMETSNVDTDEETYARPRKRPLRYLCDGGEDGSLPDMDPPESNCNDDIIPVKKRKCFDETLRELSQEIKEIKTQNDEIHKLLQAIKSMQEVGGKREDPVDHFELLKHPVNKLDELESQLQSKTLRRSFVSFLKKIGGHSPGDFVRRSMRTVGTNSLWEGFSYKGRKGKQAFCTTLVCRSIIKACLKSKDCDIKTIEQEICEYLKHAPRREGGSYYKGRDSSSTSIDTSVYLSSSDAD